MLAVPPYAWLLQASVAHNFLSSDFVTRLFVWKYHLAFRHWERLSKPKIGFACDVISLWKTYVFLIFLPRAVFFFFSTAFTPPSSKSVVHRWQGCFQRPTEKQLERARCGCLYFQWRRNIPFFLPPFFLLHYGRNPGSSGLKRWVALSICCLKFSLLHRFIPYVTWFCKRPC